MPALSNINTKLDAANNGLELAASGMSAHITSDFTFTYIITVSGTADIKISDLGIDWDFGVSNQPGTPSTDLAPKISVVKDAVNIDPKNVDVTLSGSLVAKIAGVLVPLIKSSLIPTIVKSVQDTLVKTMDTTVNPDLAKYGSRMTIPYLAGVTLDYSQYDGGITVAKDGSDIQFANSAMFFDLNKPEHYSFQPVQFPLHNPSGKDAQVYLADYVVNTMLQSGFDTGNTLDVNQILSKLNVQVTTDNLAVFIPEIVTVYGTGKQVDILAAFVNKAGQGTVTPTGAEITLDCALTFKVGDSTAASFTLSGVDFAAFLKTAPGLLNGNISKSSVGTVSNFQTTLGMTADQFQTELQNNMNKYITEANTALAAGVPITKIGPVDVHDLEINFNQGFIEGGISVTPATWEQLGQAYTMFKDEFNRIEAGHYATKKYTVEEVTSFLQ